MTEELYLKESDEALTINPPPQDIIFCKVDLVFKEKGDILLKGKKIHNDLELVNALRENFGLSKIDKLEGEKPK